MNHLIFSRIQFKSIFQPKIKKFFRDYKRVYLFTLKYFEELSSVNNKIQISDKMIPLNTDYNPFYYALNPLNYTQNSYFVTSFQPSIQNNYFPPQNNFIFYPQINTYIPQNTQQFKGILLNQVSQDQVKNTRKNSVNQNKNIKKEQSQFLNNKFQTDQESSYNFKSKKTHVMIKKIKPSPHNKNRNIIPSIIQQTLAYITKQNKSKAICQKIFNTIQLPKNNKVSVSRYYNYLRQIKQNQNNYVNESTLKILFYPQNIGIDLYTKIEQQFYLKVARILAKHFLLNISPFLTLQSKRIIKEKKLNHLSTRRLVLQIIQNLAR